MLQRALSSDPSMTEVMIHTGQHYDYAMSDSIFQELGIRPPDVNLGIGSATHAQQTAKMLASIEKVLLDVRPDWVVVFGDTNSTLAGALAAAKLNLNVAHVEAGLRSFNRSMPEEINRILTDHASTLLLTPSTTADNNLLREGLSSAIFVNVGDIMYDATLATTEIAARLVTKEKWPETTGRYGVCTIHRQENTDDPARLRRIQQALRDVARHLPILLPLHPRTARAASASGVDLGVDGVTVVPPVTYLEMQRLLQGASVVLTDSGGLQKEAYFHGVPCVTLRDETEWTETVDVGWNHVTGTDPERVLAAFAASQDPPVARPNIYGNGQSAQAIVRELKARTPDSGAVRQ
jgi:UDP-GlcNAc3NAcA epimerase